MERYSKLDNPTNGSYTYSGNTINLKWDGIKTPEAIDNNYLTNHFNEYYGNYANKYYDARIAYNITTLGTIGYEIYLKNNGVETYIGFTNMPTFTYIVPSGGEYEFVVKAAYSLFKSNRSTGHTISAKTIDNNVNDFVEDNQDNDNSNDSTELN